MVCKKWDGKTSHLLSCSLFLLTVEEGAFVTTAWHCICEPRRYLPACGLCSSNLIGKIKKNAAKKYVKYWKEGEFSPVLVIPASFDCGEFGVGFVGQDMSVSVEGG